MPTPWNCLHVDATQGASGDMILGALVDLGVPAVRIRRALETLPIDGWTLRSRRLMRCGLRLRKVDVRVREECHGRGFKELKRIVAGGELPPRAARRALAIFRRLIEAEACVHGLSPERVHLHEAGGTDAIVDVVGSCVALDHLGVDRIIVSPMTTGFGQVRCAHGVYPVPAPATARLVRGVPVRGGELEFERLTPTGAAILTTLADGWGALPPMVPIAEGYGAGSTELPEIPNALRMTLGTVERSADRASAAPEFETGEVVVLECTVDDSTPQVVAHAVGRLFEAGALDAFTTAVTMKKGRVGHNLTVLGRPDRLASLVRVMLEETSTLGVRFRSERRVELERSVERVKTVHGVVQVKVGSVGGRPLQAWPEYDSCARVAARKKLSLWEVQRAALEAHTRSRPRGRRR